MGQESEFVRCLANELCPERSPLMLIDKVIGITSVKLGMKGIKGSLKKTEGLFSL